MNRYHVVGDVFLGNSGVWRIHDATFGAQEPIVYDESGLPQFFPYIHVRHVRTTTVESVEHGTLTVENFRYETVEDYDRLRRAGIAYGHLIFPVLGTTFWTDCERLSRMPEEGFWPTTMIYDVAVLQNDCMANVTRFGPLMVASMPHQWKRIYGEDGFSTEDRRWHGYLDVPFPPCSYELRYGVQHTIGDAAWLLTYSFTFSPYGGLFIVRPHGLVTAPGADPAAAEVLRGAIKELMEAYEPQKLPVRR